MNPIEADVAAEMVASVPRSRDAIEEDAFRLLDAIEAEVAEIAIGPAVACNFESSSIEIRFCVEAATAAEIHQKISRVAEVVERVASGTLETRMAPAQRQTLAQIG